MGMGCTCRAASLRLFINGLVQVHRAEASSSSPFLHSSSIITRSSTRLTAPPQARLLHHSRLLSQEATAPSDVPPKDSVRESTGPTDAASEANPKDGSATPKSKPKKDQTERSQPSNIMFSQKPKKFFKPFVSNRKPQSPNEKFSQRPKKFSKPFISNKRNDSLNPESAQTQAQARSRPNPSKQPTGSRDTSFKGAKPQEKDEEEEPNRKKQIELWKSQKAALKEKFPDGWMPRKRLSPDALSGIRALNAQFPDTYTTDALAQKFEVSPENIRRILKSKWRPSAEEEEDRQQRWHRRGISVWERKAALGTKPPKRWRQEGVGRDPEYHARRQHGIQRQREEETQDKERYRASRASLFSGTGKVL